MRFLRAEIYGFGKWVDKTFDLSSSALTCIYGENESGKSTLQQFLLFMLFGLPPRKRNFYKPKTSNQLGGMLTVDIVKTGVFTIERVGDKLNCLLANGEIKDEQWLNEQLRGLTREVYESIYAFSALDLTDIRNMKADELSDVLFSVGLTGATNIYQIEKQLDNQLGELFKKTGRKPFINQQINRVTDIYTKMVQYKEKESTYRDKTVLKAQLINTINETEQNIKDLQEKQLKFEKMLHIIPLINDYQQLSTRLTSFPKEISFPTDGVTRFEAIRTELLPIKSEYAIIMNNKKKYDEKITELLSETYDEQVYKRAEAIVQEKQSYENIVRDIKDLETKIEKTADVLHNLLQQIALEQTELEEIVLPFHIETTWKEISEMDLELKRANHQLADDLQIITEEMDRLKKEQVQVEQKLLPEKQVDQFKTAIHHADRFQAEINHYHQQQEKWSKWGRKRTKTATVTLQIFSGLVLLCLSIGLYMNNYTLLFISALFMIVGIGQFFYVKHSVKDLQQNTIQKPSGSFITNSEREKYEQIIKEQARLRADKQLIENELKRLNFNQLQWEERKRLYKQRENNWLDRISTERYQFPFLENMEPVHWLDLLQIVQQIKQLMQEQKQEEARLAELLKQQEKFQQQITIFATHIDRSAMTLEEVETLLHTGRTNLQLIRQYEQLQADSMSKEQELKEKINVYETEMHALFNIAQVQDEETFLHVANDLAEKQEIIKQQLKIEQQISTMFSKEHTNELLTKQVNYNEIELTMLEIKEDIERLRSVITDANKKLATVEIEIEQMEMSDDHSKTALLYQVELKQLNDIARKWATLKVAQTTLVHAKNAYQEKYLTEVIQLTSHYFQYLTNGLYERVFAPTTTKPFQVEGINYIRYTVEELSQGTIDQLYVSLRLAISKVMSDKFVIPLMIDDAFVHFDEQRTDQVLRLIRKISEEQQILLFTCKIDIAKQFYGEDAIHKIKVGS